MKAIPESTIDRMNRSLNELIERDGMTLKQAAHTVAVEDRAYTLVSENGSEFDGTALYRSPDGQYVTLWFGSDYPDTGFDSNLDIWE